MWKNTKKKAFWFLTATNQPPPDNLPLLISTSTFSSWMSKCLNGIDFLSKKRKKRDEVKNQTEMETKLFFSLYWLTQDIHTEQKGEKKRRNKKTKRVIKERFEFFKYCWN